MATETRLLTAEEFFRLPGSDKWVELVRGEVKREVPSGGEHGIVQGNIALHVWSYARERGGAALVGSGFVLQRDPDTVRGPDVSYVRQERVPAYRPDGTAAVLRPGDILDGGDAMPGFRLPVSDVFRRPGTPGT